MEPKSYLLPFAPLCVNLATQVLGYSLAAGRPAACRLGALPDDAMEFTELLSLLICFLTALIAFRMRHSFSQNSGHGELLRHCLKFFSSVKSLSSRQPPYVLGWKMAINNCYSLVRSSHRLSVVQSSDQPTKPRLCCQYHLWERGGIVIALMLFSFVQHSAKNWLMQCLFPILGQTVRKILTHFGSPEGH